MYVSIRADRMKAALCLVKNWSFWVIKYDPEKNNYMYKPIIIILIIIVNYYISNELSLKK